MKITVNYFAYLKEKMGKDCETLELKPGSHAWDIVQTVFVDPLEQERTKRHWRVAVNEEYCSYETALFDGDIVALIPPVAGG